jgi:multidrug efflux pump subunit AcrA (membrane-fusion protein)
VNSAPASSKIEVESLLAAAATRHRQMTRADRPLSEAGETTAFAAALLTELRLAIPAQWARVCVKDGTESVPAFVSAGSCPPVDHARVSAAVVDQVRHETLPAPGTPEGACVSVAVCAVRVAGDMVCVLEVATTDRLNDQVPLPELGEAFADLIRRQLLASQLEAGRRDGDLRELILRLHSQHTVEAIALVLASDAPATLNCSRISVARRRTVDRWELVCSTAVTDPDPRADATQELCRLVESAAASSRNSDKESIDTSLATTGRPTGTAGIFSRVVPLSHSTDWADADWAVVLESRDEKPSAGATQATTQILRHAVLVMHNVAAARSPLFTSPKLLWRRLRRGRAFLPTLLAAVAIIAALLVWPAPLRIEVPGRLASVSRQRVFAPEDGVVLELPVEDGSTVTAGTVLCRLRNEDLELQRESIRGELSAAQARLAALDSLRGDPSLSRNGLLSAELAELTQRVQSLTQQSRLLDQRVQTLTVTADRDGMVLGRRLRETLAGRPVARGQLLCEVADRDGGLELQLRIPEADVRHVLSARHATSDALQVDFALETSPDHVETTTLKSLDMTVDLDVTGQLSSSATADCPQAAAGNLRPGSGVIARIHCGRRPLGFVIFRRLIEAVQRRWWL